MPEADSIQLRLYCICGQKMRVSESMFGKPGKCVACRQKIRIPRLEEFPTDGSGIYLKDHPELLRTPPKAHAGARRDTPETPAEEISLGGEVGDGVPLDDLPQLRELCSFDAKIQRRLRALRAKEKSDGVAQEKAALMGYRGLLRKARDQFDEQLRQELDRTRDQLSAIEEEIGRSSLEVRSGKMSFVNYYRQMLEMRPQREALARRHLNLRAWLNAEDPAVLGGYIDLPLEDIPVEPLQLVIPPSPPTDQPLVDVAVEQLRDALLHREEAARRQLAREKMARSGSLSGSPLERATAESDAEIQRASAVVNFARSRLDQIVQDCESDAKSLKAQLKLARERLQDGTLTRGAYQTLEMDLLRAQADNSKAHALARRALHANSVADVPRAQGTFLHRLAVPREVDGIGADSILAWCAAALLLLGIFVPLLPDAPSGNFVILPGLVMGQVVLAAFLSTAAAVPMRKLRVLLFSALFLIGFIGIAAYLNSSWYADTAAGAAMRINPRWYASGGMLMLLMAMALGAAACASAAVPLRPLWGVPAGAFGLAIAYLLIVVTSFGGILRPQPDIETPEIEIAISEFGPYNTTIVVENDGWRAFWLTEPDQPAAGPAFHFLLERRIGRNSWQDAGLPLSMKLANTNWWDAFEDNTFPPTQLARNGDASFRYALAPGVYRVQLVEPGSAIEPMGRVFEVPASMAITDTMRLPGAETGPAPDLDAEMAEAAMDARPLVSGERPAEMELIGIIDGEGRSPSFYVSIALPNSRPTSRYIQLGDQIHAGWSAQEYNPQTQKLYLSNGKNLLALMPGERLTLEQPRQ